MIRTSEMSAANTEVLSTRDESLLFESLISACSTFSSEEEIEVLLNPTFDFIDYYGTRNFSELCDVLIISPTQVIMFEMKTRCLPNVSETWMRAKPFSARKQSFLSAQKYLNNNGEMRCELESGALSNKNWSHITVMNSAAEPGSLHFVSSHSMQDSFEPDSFFFKYKNITLDEICAATGVTDVDGFFSIPSVMDAN